MWCCAHASSDTLSSLRHTVFIEKRNVRKAIAALQHQFVVDVEGPSELIHGTTTAAPTATTADATADAARSNTSTNASASKASSAFSFHHHKLCVLPIQLRVAKLVKDRIPVGMHGLVATLFLEDTHPSTTSTPRIASFTETEDEVRCALRSFIMLLDLHTLSTCCWFTGLPHPAQR